MISKALVYPFDQQFLPIMETRSVPRNLQVTHCISPKGWGFTGKDVSYTAYGLEQGIIISDDFQSALLEVDAAIFFPFQNYLDQKQSLLPKIHQAIDLGKSVYCCCQLEESEIASLTQKAKNNKTTFLHYDNKQLDINLDINIVLREKKLHKISIPVVYITSVMELSGKFSVQLKFAEYLRSQGYKVSVITSKPYAQFVNEHPLINALFGNSFSEQDKIFIFNAYINHIQNTECPDIIIVSIPGGLLQLKEEDASWFGITAFEMTRAVTPDASFLITYYENYETSHIEELISMLNSRFSLNISALIVNNLMVDLTEETHFSYVNNCNVEKLDIISNLQGSAFSLQNLEGAFTAMVNALSNFSEIEEI